MSFDQFQRYKTVQIIVDNIKRHTGLKKVSVLEIGSNGQCNLEEMLPQEKIQYSNLTIPEVRMGDDRFIALDGTDMPEVETDAYDVVVALDVFEHVPEERRERFLKETNRVAKYMTILCFPFANGQNESTEQRVNNYYKAIYGKNHIWLEEHIENGLPNRREVKEILEKEHIPYGSFEHGDIIIWEEWMKVLFGSYDIPGVLPYLESVEEYYEQNIYPHDVGEDNYRVFLMLSKQDGLAQKMEEEIKERFKIACSTEICVDKRRQLFRGLADLKQLCGCKACSKIQSSLYTDCGSGYTEDNKIICETAAEDKQEINIRCRYQLPPSVKGLRFDPVEGCGCVVSKIFVDSNVGELILSPANGWKQEGRYIFPGNDPQFWVDLEGKNIEWVEVVAELYIYPETKEGLLLGAAEKMINESRIAVMEAVHEKEEALRCAEERWAEEHAKAELYENAYNGILQSKTWKMTAPLRKIFGKEK